VSPLRAALVDLKRALHEPPDEVIETASMTML
jgi:hypothetical protein